MRQSRRQFLATTATGLAGILAAKTPPARGQQREISYLCWNNFAPASDKKLAEIGPRFTKDTGIKIRIDHIAAPQQAAKYASEVQTQAGHDIVEMRMHFPWLYEPQLLDLSDLVAEMEKKYGKPPARLGFSNLKDPDIYAAVGNLSGHAAVLLFRAPKDGQAKAFAYTD